MGQQKTLLNRLEVETSALSSRSWNSRAEQKTLLNRLEVETRLLDEARWGLDWVLQKTLLNRLEVETAIPGTLFESELLQKTLLNRLEPGRSRRAPEPGDVEPCAFAFWRKR